ncbi:MAG: peptide chain release factor N(5)-glutamine methyltransferase [Pseudorhodoplanes sp.]|nr:peptide chain release factor N(5)-glutamine methyltransferase [Pseudorhodoplanes sp.]
MAALAAGVTVAAERRAIARLLEADGIDSASLDARLLIAHALGVDAARLAADAERPLSAGQCRAIATLAERRRLREPVARILGVKEFWSLPLRLSPETLVPRPETETIVEAALQQIRDRNATLRISDIGTGSGALLLALLSELPNAFGIGTDISVSALATARTNAQSLGLHMRAGFIACNFAAALRGPFDLVVSNPPYIPRGDIAGLAPEVRDHDPAAALDGGADGLDCYRIIAHQTAALLAPHGTLIVELGAGQERAVAAIMEGAGLRLAGPARRDLAGHPRALILRPLP